MTSAGRLTGERKRAGRTDPLPNPETRVHGLSGRLKSEARARRQAHIADDAAKA